MNRAPQKPVDFAALLLLTGAIQVAILRLVATDWLDALGLSVLFAFLGTALGLALGYSRFKRTGIYLLTLAYLAVFLAFLVAAFLYPELDWVERYIRISERLHLALQILLGGQPLEDPFLFLLFFFISAWSLGAHAGFAFARFQRLGAAIFPATVTILLLQIFDENGDRNLIFLAVHLIFVLLLFGRSYYTAQRALWKERRLLSSAEAQSEIIFALALSATGLVLLAWLLPVPDHHLAPLERWRRDLAEAWEKNETINNLTASLRTRETVASSLYGRTLALGQEAPRSDVVLFYVEGPARGSKPYWRVRSYEIYQDGLWRDGAIAQEPFRPEGAPLTLPEEQGELQRFWFTLVSGPVNVLVTPRYPVWVSRASSLVYTPVDSIRRDPISFQLAEPLFPGERYAVQVLQPAITEKALRAAGKQYPLWVTERYLQLPEGFPSALAALAREITATASTPYDQALAITRYLRNTIRYTTSMPPAPPGRDPIVWFLFDYQAGFCNYYATAEVLLLRSLGVPARLVVGYATGEYSDGRYVVRERHAHAWPEVFFPGIGWVAFEPTSVETELVYPSGEPPALSTPETSLPLALPQEESNPPADLEEGGDFSLFPSRPYPDDSLRVLTLFFIISLVLIGLLVWGYLSGAFEKGYNWAKRILRVPLPVVARDWLRQKNLPVPAWLEKMAWRASLHPTERAFLSIYESLRRFRGGVPPSPAWTPAEAAARLLQDLPEAQEETLLLLEGYHRFLFSRAATAHDEMQRAAQALRQKTRRALWKRSFAQYRNALSLKKGVR